MAADIALGEAGLLVPGRWRWARALAWLCVLAVLCVAAFNIAADASLRLSAMVADGVFTSRADAPAGARLIAVIVGSIAMLAAYALAVALVERRKIPELGLRRLLPELALGVVLGCVLIAAIIGSMWAAGWVTIAAATPSKITEALKLSVQSGVIEEVLMRIVMFRLLWRAAGALPALIATAVLFGALHLSNPDATVFSALCLIAGEGIGAGLYVLSGRVWLPIGMHAGWNFAQGWIFGSAVSGFDEFAGGPLLTQPVAGIDAMLSGGGFGPESSLAALIVSLLASALCLGLAWRRGRFAAG
jgi:membrane protease YdiL (CAAX protease family)